MRISSVRVVNFRCIREETLHCDHLTALVGRNGSGKSSFLRALDIFYTPVAQYTEEDFYNRDTSQPILIQVTFKNLSEEEQELFSPYLDGENLAVEKELTWPKDRNSQKYYGSKPKNPDFQEVRTARPVAEKREAYRRLRDLEKYRVSLPGLPASVSGKRIDEELDKWEREHPEQLTRARDEGQFFGFREVGQARLERFTRFIYVPAVRDAAGDAVEGRGSLISEIMDIVVRSSLAQRDDLRQLREEVQSRYREIMDPAQIQELQNLAVDMTSTLQTFAPDARVQIEWTAEEAIDIPLPKAYVLLEEDGYPSPVERAGHGVQRAFVLTALQHLVLARASVSGAEASAEEQEKDNQFALSNLILGIEEPEIYQHPSRQRHLAQVFLQLTSSGVPGVSRDVQIIYTTHSPLLVDLQRFDHIRVLRKEPADKGGPKQTKVFQATIERVTRERERAHDAPDGSYEAEGTRARLRTLMTPWTNEGFFAEKVVLVEGEDDRAAILGAAAAMAIDLEAADIAVIPCMGKTNLLKAAAVFRQFGIPIYVVWDCDMGKGDPKIDVNHSIMRFFGHGPEDYPEMVTEDFACFAKDLNAIIRHEITDELYEALLAGCQRDFGYADKGHARKSPQVVQTVLERASAQGRECATLKQIVSRICGNP